MRPFIDPDVLAIADISEESRRRPHNRTTIIERKRQLKLQVLAAGEHHLFPSLEALRSRCPNASVQLLRVPKTGSTSLLSTLTNACDCADGSHKASRSRADRCWAPLDHQAPSSRSCEEAAIGTLREPCERFSSLYVRPQKAMA